MRKITDRIWRFPDQLFYGEVVNVWLFADDDKLVIIDGPNASISNLQFISSLDKLSIIVLTHSPCLGEAETFRREIGSQIAIHEAARLETLDFEPDLYIKDGERLSSNTMVIHTPGHKPEHVCLYSPLEHGSMFTGDAVQADSAGNIIDPYQPGTDWNNDLNIESLKKLLSYKFERILPFHYYPLLTHASEKLRQSIISKEVTDNHYHYE